MADRLWLRSISRWITRTTGGRSSGSCPPASTSCSNTTVPPGVVPFLEQLGAAGFQRRGGRLVCTYFEENIVGALPSALIEGAYGCLDYYQTVTDPFSTALLDRYNARFPGAPKFSAGSAATGMYRGLEL